MTIELDAGTLRALAVKASCDDRTIQKAARGEHIRGMAGHRARKALRDAGYTPPEPPPATPPPAPPGAK